MSAMAPYWADRQREEGEQPAVKEQCECGASIIFPAPGVAAEFFVCDACSRRWGVEVSENSQGIWPL